MVSTWALARSLPATASESEIESETVRVVEDDDYFLVCKECGERNPGDGCTTGESVRDAPRPTTASSTEVWMIPSSLSTD